MLVNVLVVILTSILIYYAGKYFASSSSNVGEYFGLSKSAKGATLDAISSSAPELMISLFGLIIFHKFSVGIGTIVGSALFNLLIIPAICVFLSPIVFKFSDDVVDRDGLFYNLTVIIFLTAVFFSKEWSIWIAIVFLGVYLLYILEIFRHGTNSNYVSHISNFFRVKSKRESKKKINLWFEINVMFVTLSVIGVSSYFLVEHAIILSNFLSIHPIIISFTIIAAATSFPDLVISAVNAKKGNISDALSNVFGSNIFDILIGLGFPVLIARLLRIPVIISVESVAILFSLLSSTAVVLYFLAESRILTKFKAAIMILIYFAILIYTVSLI